MTHYPRITSLKKKTMAFYHRNKICQAKIKQYERK